EAAREESGAHDEERSDGSLAHEQHVAKASRARAAESPGDRTVAAVERRRQVEGRTADRGKEARQEGGGHRDTHREDADPGADPDLLQARKVRGSERATRPHQHPGQQRPDDRARRREEETLSEQLATELQPPGTERGAQRELALTCDAAREE